MFGLVYNGEFEILTEEIDEIKFWDRDEIEEALQTTPDIFTPNVRQELLLIFEKWPPLQEK